MESQKKRILIVGGYGMVGSHHISNWLKEFGFEITEETLESL